MAEVEETGATADCSANTENSTDITQFSLFMNKKKNSSSWYLAEFILSKCLECASVLCIVVEVDAIAVMVIFIVVFVAFVVAKTFLFLQMNNGGF